MSLPSPHTRRPSDHAWSLRSCKGRRLSTALHNAHRLKRQPNFSANNPRCQAFFRQIYGVIDAGKSKIDFWGLRRVCLGSCRSFGAVNRLLSGGTLGLFRDKRSPPSRVTGPQSGAQYPAPGGGATGYRRCETALNDWMYTALAICDCVVRCRLNHKEAAQPRVPGRVIQGGFSESCGPLDGNTGPTLTFTRAQNVPFGLFGRTSISPRARRFSGTGRP